MISYLVEISEADVYQIEEMMLILMNIRNLFTLLLVQNPLHLVL
jgi:hypothetical protein